MFVQITILSETFVAEFAWKPPLFVRLNASFHSSGRVVTLVVRVQFIDAAMVTLANLTHNVATTARLKNKLKSFQHNFTIFSLF